MKWVRNFQEISEKLIIPKAFPQYSYMEQSIQGGAAHLLNFSSSDTLAANYYVQYYLNNGNPVGTCLPSADHSTISSFVTEREALKTLINHYGTGIYSTVSDTYSSINVLENILPSLVKLKSSRGGVWLLKQNSETPVETILIALRSLEKSFGAEVNSKGYKIINNAGNNFYN